MSQKPKFKAGDILLNKNRDEYFLVENVEIPIDEKLPFYVLLKLGTDIHFPYDAWMIDEAGWYKKVA